MPNDAALETLLDRLPVDVVESFSDVQRAALYNAINPLSWRKHPINIRLSFPIFGDRYFVTVVGGSELRSSNRISRERRMFPLGTVGNALFLAGVGSAFYLAAMAGILALSRLIDF